MKIKLRGKTWKQITLKEFRETKENTAMFIDYKYDEKTYFKKIKRKKPWDDVKKMNKKSGGKWENGKFMIK